LAQNLASLIAHASKEEKKEKRAAGQLTHQGQRYCMPSAVGLGLVHEPAGQGVVASQRSSHVGIAFRMARIGHRILFFQNPSRPALGVQLSLTHVTLLKRAFGRLKKGA